MPMPHAAKSVVKNSESLDAVTDLPPIPNKRYFTIGEVSELCAVKPHVLRYWEQEFSTLRPVKRRGTRRYYQQRDVELVREIRHLLYDKGFTIGGARQQLQSASTGGKAASSVSQELADIRKELEAIIKQLG